MVFLFLLKPPKRKRKSRNSSPAADWLLNTQSWMCRVAGRSASSGDARHLAVTNDPLFLLQSILQRSSGSEEGGALMHGQKGCWVVSCPQSQPRLSMHEPYPFFRPQATHAPTPALAASDCGGLRHGPSVHRMRNTAANIFARSSGLPSPAWRTGDGWARTRLAGWDESPYSMP